MLNLKFYLFVFGNILRFSNGVGSAKLQGVPYDVKAAHAGVCCNCCKNALFMVYVYKGPSV